MKNEEKTNWTKYYSNPFKISYITRSITSNILLNYIRKHITKKEINIIEIGGANSCFYEKINNSFQVSRYVVIDNNQFGLDLLAERINDKKVKIVHNDILKPEFTDTADLVFSIGLVEHFSPDETKRAIINHFNYVDSHGIVIISFPTPTLLYRITRKLAELLGIWIFHDERPIKLDEVIPIISSYGNLLDTKIIYSIILTQAIIVVRKY
jgi:hypothetical protein